MNPKTLINGNANQIIVSAKGDWEGETLNETVVAAVNCSILLRGTIVFI